MRGAAYELALLGGVRALHEVVHVVHDELDVLLLDVLDARGQVGVHDEAMHGGFKLRDEFYRELLVVEEVHASDELHVVGQQVWERKDIARFKYRTESGSHGR